MVLRLARWLFLVVLAGSTAGCLLKEPMYVPVSANQTVNVAVISDHWNDYKKADFPRLARAELYYLEGIDGKPVENAWNTTRKHHNADNHYISRMAVFEPVEHQRKVPTRQMKLLLRGLMFHGGIIDGLIEDRLPVDGVVFFVPTDGESYRVNGELSATYSAVWLEDRAGNRVTEKIERRK